MAEFEQHPVEWGAIRDLQRLKRDTESARLPAATSAVNGAGRKLRLGWKVLVAATAVVAILAAGGYFYFHRTPKLTDKDTVVLADFTNTTGDAVFDSALREGLASQLEQSPFLSIVPEQQVQQTLRQMGKSLDVQTQPAPLKRHGSTSRRRRASPRRLRRELRALATSTRPTPE